jgi:DNA-binding IclR family transcriptional regulator
MLGWQYHYVDNNSGVGVLDKAVRVLDALEAGPAALGDLAVRTGLPRATAHRLAVALEVHQLVGRTDDGRFQLGPRISPVGDLLAGTAEPVLRALRDATGESAQCYIRTGSSRRCIAAAERASGLRDTVPVGTVLPMTAGSAAHVLLAWSAEPLPRAASFDADELAATRRRGWADSVEEREAGLGSVSAPVFAADGSVVAALSVSGPLQRLTRSPGRRHGAAVVSAAAEVGEALSRGRTSLPTR